MTHGGRHNADERLILKLAIGRTIAEAAAAAGVSPRTAHRRMEDEAFRERVQTARAEMLFQAMGRLANASGRAVETLESLLDADADTVRLGAARSILEIGNRFRESIELEARLQAIESTIESTSAKER